MEKQALPQFSDIIAAVQVLANDVKETPLEHSKSFSKMADCNIFMKMENLQATGSFKVRGAYHKIARLTGDLSHGVVAASAGNHAQGVALAAQRHGIKASIFIPSTA